MAKVTSIHGEIFIVYPPGAVDAMVDDPTSGIIRDLFVRGERVRAAAIRIAPRRTGNLANHIVKRLVKGPKGRPVMLVGVESVPYALGVHEGTREHDIVPVRAPFLVFMGRDGKLVFTKIVHHPGNKPNRFLLRAMSAA